MASSMIDALLAGARVVSKHEGPGPHDTGTPQSAHAGDSKQPGSEKGAISTPFGLEALSDALQSAILDTVAKRESEHNVDLGQGTLTGRLRRLWDASRSDDRERFEEERRWYQGANRYGANVGEAFGADESRAAGVLAALSPQTSWGRNQDMAADLMGLLYEDPVVLRPGTRRRVRMSELTSTEIARMLSGLDHPELRVQTGRRRGEPTRLFDQSIDNLTKAVDIYRGEDVDGVLGGSKVRSFYNNILLPNMTTSWTDDTHMKRIWLDDPDVGGDDRPMQHLWAPTPVRSAEGYDGPGLYPYFATVGRRTADELGVLPHEVQAVTWSQWRRQTGVQDRDDRRGMSELGSVLEQLNEYQSPY